MSGETQEKQEQGASNVTHTVVSDVTRTAQGGNSGGEAIQGASDVTHTVVSDVTRTGETQESGEKGGSGRGNKTRCCCCALGSNQC